MLRELHDDEQGTTLMELIVGMALFAAFMGMFTGAMFLMSNTVNKVQAIGSSSGQVNAAFLRLDNMLRYATGISVPAQAPTSSDYHVEFGMVKAGYDRRLDVQPPKTSDTAQCVQLRVDGTSLQQRTWTPDAAGTGYVSGSLSSWVTLATNIQPPTSNPFVDPNANVSTSASTSFDQLTVTLTATSGSTTSATTTRAMTFTALNSVATSSAPVCQQLSADASA